MSLLVVNKLLRLRTFSNGAPCRDLSRLRCRIKYKSWRMTDVGCDIDVIVLYMGCPMYCGARKEMRWTASMVEKSTLLCMTWHFLVGYCLTAKDQFDRPSHPPSIYSSKLKDQIPNSPLPKFPSESPSSVSEIQMLCIELPSLLSRSSV